MLFRKPPTSSAVATLSVIASDVLLVGTLTSEGTIDFGGSINGNIHCHTLTLRAGGNVNGDIEADTVHIYGKTSGLIKASSVHLYAGCNVEGVVMHETLTMEDGASLDGKCKRMDKAELEKTEAAAPVIEKPALVMPFFEQEDDAPIVNVRMLDNIRLIR